MTNLLQQQARGLTYIIVSDSQAAIQHITNPRSQSGQAVIKRIYKLASNLQSRNAPAFRLQWIPAHANVKGDEIADKLAKQAIHETLTDIQELLIPTALKAAREIQTIKMNRSNRRRYIRIRIWASWKTIH
jgi:ribonuclease HI